MLNIVSSKFFHFHYWISVPLYPDFLHSVVRFRQSSHKCDDARLAAELLWPRKRTRTTMNILVQGTGQRQTQPAKFRLNSSQTFSIKLQKLFVICSAQQNVHVLSGCLHWEGKVNVGGGRRLLKCWETAQLPLPSCPHTRCLCGASSFLLNCKSKCICKCISGLEDETYPLYPLRLHQHLVQATPAPSPWRMWHCWLCIIIEFNYCSTGSFWGGASDSTGLDSPEGGNWV